MSPPREQDMLAGVRLSLRRAYEDVLSAPADPEADAMMKLLLEMSVHEMAAC